MNVLTPPKRSMLQMLACATLWSLGGILIKLIPWGGLSIVSARSFVSGVVLLIYMKLFRVRFVVNKRTWFAAVTLAMSYICFVMANKLTTAANAIVLQFTSPVFILIISVLFLHKRFSYKDVIAVALTLSGISLFFFDELGSGHLLGNCIAILSGASFAGMYLTMGEAQEPERITAILLAQAITLIVGLPALLAEKETITLMPIIYIIILGALQLGIPCILLAKAIEYCPPLACALLGAIEPILNPILVMIFVGETPGPCAIVGAIVVIITITIWNIPKK